MHPGGRSEIADERLGLAGTQPESAAHAHAAGACGAVHIEASMQFVYNDKAHGQALPLRSQRGEKGQLRSLHHGESIAIFRLRSSKKMR